MNWINLEHLLLKGHADRRVSVDPELNHDTLRERALRLAGGLQQRGVRRVAVHLEDAAELAQALLGAWQAGVSVLLPADLQAQTRLRWDSQVDLWITQSEELQDRTPILCLQRNWIWTSASSACAPRAPAANPNGSTKSLRQMANEVQALEQLWGADLGDACIIASVAAQHIYGLLFRVLWPLCAGRSFVRKQLAFPEDMQRASREHAALPDASPALLKRMADNLDWPALSSVRRVFSWRCPARRSSPDAVRTPGPVADRDPRQLRNRRYRLASGATPVAALADVQLSQSSDGALIIASSYLPKGHVEHTADAARIEADGRFELLEVLGSHRQPRRETYFPATLEQALVSHDWVAEARLGVVHDKRASLGALLVLSASGLFALREQGRRAPDSHPAPALESARGSRGLAAPLAFAAPVTTNSQGKLPGLEPMHCYSHPGPSCRKC